jgi:hypothetical protein
MHWNLRQAGNLRQADPFNHGDPGLAGNILQTRDSHLLCMQ